jgi:hypothetical protein
MLVNGYILTLSIGVGVGRSNLIGHMKTDPNGEGEFNCDEGSWCKRHKLKKFFHRFLGSKLMSIENLTM